MLMAVDVRPELLLYWVEEGAIVFHQRYQLSAVWRRTVSAAMPNALIWPFLEPHSEATEAVSPRDCTQSYELSTDNIVITLIIQRRWIWYRPFHRPTL